MIFLELVRPYWITCQIVSHSRHLRILYYLENSIKIIHSNVWQIRFENGPKINFRSIFFSKFPNFLKFPVFFQISNFNFKISNFSSKCPIFFFPNYLQMSKLFPNFKKIFKFLILFSHCHTPTTTTTQKTKQPKL